MNAIAFFALCACVAAAAPPKAANDAVITFDILPDAGELVTRLGTECETGTAAQAQSSSSSFSMILPGNILVSASFSEARAAAGTGPIAGTPNPFRGRGVRVTAPNGATYNIRAPVEADFKVEGPEGTRSVVQRQLPAGPGTAAPPNSTISFPKP